MELVQFARDHFPRPVSRTLRKLGAALLLALLLAAISSLARGGLKPSVPISHEGPLQAGHAAAGPGTVVLNAMTETGRPRMEVPVRFYDFGPVSDQAVARHDFLIANYGSGALLIRRAYTTCGCTTAALSASRIPPGQAALVTVEFNAGFHRMAGQTVRRGLILETNDPDQPEVEIWVQAGVR